MSRRRPGVTKPLFDHFFPAHVVAYVSDRTRDFKLKDDQLVLEDDQRQFLAAQLNFNPADVVNIRQVHDKRIVKAGEGYAKGRTSLEEADGIVTDTVNLPIVIRTADCLPIFICDVRQQCIGLVHAGWRGSQKNIVGEAMLLMYKYWRSSLSDIKVALGPAIQPCCYQVGEELTKYFPREIMKKDQSYYLDLPSVNKNQLIRLGISEKNIFDCAICTVCDQHYFSYRREGEAAGRMISLMMMKG